MRYKKASVDWVTESRRIRGTELYRQQKTPSCTMELKSSFSLNQAWPQPTAMAALISCKVWFLFITLTVAVVVGSPTTDLLESVDCLLRDCVRYFKNVDRNNDRFSSKLASGRPNTTHKLVDNVKHDLESLLEQIGFSSFLSLARIITFSPPRTRSKPPSLKAFYSFPPFTL